MMRGGSFILRVFGGLDAGHDGVRCPPVVFSTRKAGALLSVLALNPQQSASREHLASLLWGNSPDRQARQSLRQALVLLRKDLGPHEIIDADAHTVGLRPGTVWVDALELEALAPCTDFDSLARAAALFRGELLAGVTIKEENFETWLRQQRRRFEAIGSDVLARYAACADAMGRGADAIAAVERLLGIDPLREDWQRLALQLYARHRGPNQALAQADAFARHLWQELSVEPEAETQRLIEQIRRGALARTTPAPADRPPVLDAAPRAIAPLAGTTVQSISTQDVAPSVPQWLSRATAAASWSEVRSRLHFWLRSRSPIGRVAGAVAGAGAMAGLVFLAMTTQFAAPPPDASVLSVQGPVPASGPPQPVTAPDATTARFENGVVTLVVLPFTAHGGDANDAQKSDASGAIAGLITDELTTTLSSSGAIRVISGATARTFRGQTVDAARIGAELGVAYLLEGSTSMRGNHLRVNVGLVETATGLRVWSRRFERSGDDRLTLQDEIINGLCRELQIDVTRIAGERGSRAADVHTTVLQGWSKINAAGALGKDALQEAEKLFSAALNLDPGNTRAQLGLAAYHIGMALQLYAPDPATHLAKAESLLDGLLKRRPHMATAHALVGLAHFAHGRLPEAKRAFEHAITLNPSHAPSYAQLGRVLLQLGQRQAALEHIHYAIRLSPRDPHLPYWLGLAGSAELELEHFDAAVMYFGRAIALNPKHPRNVLALAAAQALVGDVDAARRGLAQLQRDQPHLNRETLVQRFSDGGPHSAQIRRGMGLVLGETLQSTAAASTPPP